MFIEIIKKVTYPVLKVVVMVVPVIVVVVESYYYYCYNYFTLLKVFMPTLADGFSLEFEWQQVSSSFQDSSQYSSQS